MIHFETVGKTGQEESLERGLHLFFFFFAFQRHVRRLLLEKSTNWSLLNLRLKVSRRQFRTSSGPATCAEGVAGIGRMRKLVGEYRQSKKKGGRRRKMVYARQPHGEKDFVLETNETQPPTSSPLVSRSTPAFDVFDGREFPRGRLQRPRRGRTSGDDLIPTSTLPTRSLPRLPHRGVYGGIRTACNFSSMGTSCA